MKDKTIENFKEIGSFFKDGFAVINLFTKKDINLILSDIEKYYFEIGKKNGVSITKLKSYHRYPISDEIHNSIMQHNIRQIKLKGKFVKKIQHNTIVKSITKFFYGQKKFGIFCEYKNYHRSNHTSVRIVKPLAQTSGVHTESNASPNYDPITLWCPLVGYDNKYTLRLAPGSHFYSHPKSNIVKDKYTAKSYNNSYLKKFKFIRPNVKKGQAIIFDPNILHGGSVCFGKLTRVSIEPRILRNESFYKKKNKLNSLNHFFLKNFLYKK
tara:strand:- start:1822 stop:2625 length:804 start_codon:yes stop_codon:yes gene_type:complete